MKLKIAGIAVLLVCVAGAALGDMTVPAAGTFPLFALGLAGLGLTRRHLKENTDVFDT
ncbi:MAG: hypothetical protein R3208_17915 [Ketobacteraceae bacterium]|nr:hypothetical protein [Ketobacteraceae bacterium]